MASSHRGGLANQVLKNAGLLKKDEDTNMRDLSVKRNHKTTNKKGGNHRLRSMNIYKSAPEQKMVNAEHSCWGERLLSLRPGVLSLLLR